MSLKLSRPVVYTLLFAVMAYAYVVLTEEDSPRRRTTTSSKPRSSSSRQVAQATSLPEDYTAKFQPVVTPAKNAFAPLVKGRTQAASEQKSTPYSIPADLTDGDPNWIFTGMATVDDVPVALLENKASGEGVFLKLNQKWKGLTVRKIRPDTLGLSSESGERVSIEIYSEEQPQVASMSRNAPLRPQLSGPINRSMQIVPDRSTQPMGGGMSMLPELPEVTMEEIQR